MIRLTPYEYELFEHKVKRARITKSSFIRKVLRNEEIREAPPYEFHEFNIELKRIGTNLNQIARQLNANDPEERPAITELRKLASDMYDILGKIQDEYFGPIE